MENWVNEAVGCFEKIQGWDDSGLEHLPSMLLRLEVNPQHWEGQTRHRKFTSDKQRFCLFFLSPERLVASCRLMTT